MSLIEGIDDEVTIVCGLFFLVIVVLLAWLSTRTDDISLFREVGFIVVELSQRRTFQRNGRTEDQNASLPAGQEAQTGSEQVISDEQVQSESVHGVEQVPNQTSESAESSASPTEIDLSSDLVGPPSQNVGADSSASLNENSGESKVTLPSKEEKEDVTQLDTSHAAIDEEVVINDNGLRNTSSSRLPLDGEEIRQRRVQYFQGGAQRECQAQQSSLLHENSHTIRHYPKDSQPEEHSGASSSAKSDSTESNASRRSLNNETNVAEDQPAPVLTSTDAETSTDSSSQAGASSVPESNSQIRVKLRYVNETQRDVFAKPDDTIGEFRRTHFQSELEENKWVRFIFNGQDLRDDARTLQACNIVNNSTMHCLVTSQNRTQAQPDTATDEEEDSVLGTMMYPLFTILLAIVWYFRFTYRQYFSAMSTVCLIGISFILFLSYISSFRMSDSQQTQQQRQPSSGSANSRPQNSN